MNKITIMLLFAFSVLSCNLINDKQSSRKHTSFEKKQDLNIDSSNKAIFKKLDSVKMLKMGEPEIENYNGEIFRFKEVIPLTFDFYLTAVQLKDSSYQLISKCIFRGSENIFFKRASIDYKLIYLDDLIGHIDTFIYFEVKQKMDKVDWIKFKGILNGSYYWSFTEPTKEVHKFDPHSLSLQSRSILPMGISQGKLKYHENYITIPIKGSFTDAYDFLGQKTDLFKKLGTKNYTYDFRF